MDIFFSCGRSCLQLAMGIFIAMSNKDNNFCKHGKGLLDTAQGMVLQLEGTACSQHLVSNLKVTSGAPVISYLEPLMQETEQDQS